VTAFKISGIFVNGQIIPVESERQARIEQIAGAMEQAFPTVEQMASASEQLWPGMPHQSQRRDVLRRDCRDAMRLALERCYGGGEIA
jgi:hypothetical protein